MSEVPVLLWEMTRRQFREGVDEGRIVGTIVPTGSTEQHNEHLEMVHDTESVVHIARLVAEKLHPHVVVTTPLSIGISEHWMDHKGTLTARPEVFIELLHDVCNSMRRGGIRNILILNGHAGNTHPIQDRLEDLRKRLILNLDFCAYWEAYTKEDVAKYYGFRHLPRACQRVRNLLCPGRLPFTRPLGGRRLRPRQAHDLQPGAGAPGPEVPPGSQARHC